MLSLSKCEIYYNYKSTIKQNRADALLSNSFRSQTCWAWLLHGYLFFRSQPFLCDLEISNPFEKPCFQRHVCFTSTISKLLHVIFLCKTSRETGFSSGCAFCSKFLCSYSHSTMQVLRTVNPNRFFESQHHGEKGEPISQRLGITAVLINHQLLAIELLIHALLGVLHRLSVHHFDQPSSPPLP